jgi:hypothetical protein
MAKLLTAVVVKGEILPTLCRDLISKYVVLIRSLTFIMVPGRGASPHRLHRQCGTLTQPPDAILQS